MRFIRDIIAEKQNNRLSSGSSQSGETVGSGTDFEIDDFEVALEEKGITKEGNPALPSQTAESVVGHGLGLDAPDELDFLEGEEAEGQKLDTAPEERRSNPEACDRNATDAAATRAMEARRATEDVSRPDPRPAQVADRQPDATNVNAQKVTDEVASSQPTIEKSMAKAPPPSEQMSERPVEVPRPAAGRSAARSGRVKTRLLGFGAPQDTTSDPFKEKTLAAPSAHATFPVGWLIVVDGPGRGAAFTIHSGVAQIGRSPDQAVSLGFGDNSISRENHAAIAYDDEQRAFFLGHGGKANLVRLNGRPVLSTEELRSEDVIRIGETTLRFIALCGAHFSWSQHIENGTRDVAAE